MAKHTRISVKNESSNNRVIGITLGQDYYQVVKDKFSFNIFKRNGPGNMQPMGVYPSTFGRTLEFILDDASRKTDQEVQTIREYINDIRSIYDQLREVKASWQLAGNKDGDDLGIPELPPLREPEPAAPPVDEFDEF